MNKQNQITHEVNDVTKIKIVCGRCEKRAEILWHELYPGALFFAFLRVRCHGDDRIVEITQMQTRIAELSGFDELAILWEQLYTVDADEFRAQQAAELRRVEEFAEEVEAEGKGNAEIEEEISDAVRKVKRRLEMVRALIEARR